MSGDSVIDGPIRVILNNWQLKVMVADLGGKAGYEEVWTFERKTTKYYSNLYHQDPTDLDLFIDLGGDATLTVDFNYFFQFVKRFSEFVRTDTTSFVLMGEAPNNVNGIDVNFANRSYIDSTQKSGGSWPLTLNPDKNGANDDIDSGGNPSVNHVTDSNAPSASTLPYVGYAGGGAQDAQYPGTNFNNPLSDWYYLSTSSGGAWSYVPYQEWYVFASDEAKNNRDLATYWKDTNDYSEIGMYGQNPDSNGHTDDYEMRTVFGNFSAWECQREYARMKYLLNDNVTVEVEIYPGGALFEDTDVYINEALVTGGDFWVTNGDKIWIDCDMDAPYLTNLWGLNDSYTNLGYSNFGITEKISATHVYRVEFYVDDTENRVPPLNGLNTRIQVNTTPASYQNEEFYLDNTNPVAPTTFNAQQNEASVELAWSGQSDNGAIDRQEIIRNGTKIATISSTANSWIDYNILDGKEYNYKIRVCDKVEQSSDSATDTVTISLSFNPAQPAEPADYFKTSITIDWSSNPGDSVIDVYRLWWAEDLNKDLIADGLWSNLGFIGLSTSDTFTPSTDAGTPQNGSYIFKVESIDNDASVNLNSSIITSLYDDEIPYSGVIIGIPDYYQPENAEINVQWSSEFDAFSGIDYFILEKDTGTASAPDGSWEEIGTFQETTHTYSDISVLNNTWYWYRITTVDNVGNSATTALEKTQYFSPSITKPNIKLEMINTTISSQSRGSGNTFDVNVKATNIGTAQGTVNNIVLDFSHSTHGDVSFQYTIGSTPSFGTINNGTYQVYTFTGIYASSSAYEGEISIDATMTWNTTDIDYESDEIGSIWIRDFKNIWYDTLSAEDPAETGDSMEINMTFYNPMTTSMNITDYNITLGEDEGWTEGVDYTIESVIGPSVSNGFILTGGSSEDVIFYVAVGGSASIGLKYVDAQVTGSEIVTSLDVTNNSISIDSFSAVLPDTTAPSITNMDANPSNSDPDNDDVVTIFCNATDVSGISVITATIKYSNGSIASTFSLYDDGTHGDTYVSDNGFTNQWDSSTADKLDTLSVTFYAEDGSKYANSKEEINGATITLIDSTDPLLSAPTALPGTIDPEAGDSVTITLTIEDWSGIQTVNAVIEYSNGTDVTTIDLYDDGTHGDSSASDGIYGNTWNSLGYAEDTYYVDYTAVDSSPNSNTATLNDGATFDLVDSTLPSITNVQTNGPVEKGNDIVITAEVDDLNDVTSVYATMENGSYVTSIQLFDDGFHNDGSASDGVFGNIINSLIFSEDTYNIDVNATDGSNSNNYRNLNDGTSFVIQDTTIPSIINPDITPNGGSIGTNFGITVEVSDNSGIASVYATISDVGGWLEGIILYDDGTHGDTVAYDEIYSNSWDSTGYSTGNYDVSINTTDGGDSSLVNSSSNFEIVSLTLEDTNAPTIINIQSNPDKANPGDVLVISADISDDTGFFTPNVTITDGVWAQTYDLVLQSGNTWAYSWDTTGRSVNLYDVRINATDNSANFNSESILSVDLVNVTNDDFKAPSITDISDLIASEVGTSFLIYATCTDDQAISHVFAYIQSPDGNIVAVIELSDSGLNNYTGTWDSTGFEIGTYWLDIFANDSTGNNNNIDNYGGSFGLVDSVVPVLHDSFISSTIIEYGQSITITLNVSDPSGINTVTVYLQDGNENTVATIQLFDDGIAGGHGDSIAGDGNYTNVWSTTSFNVNANWEIDIMVEDSSSNNNQLNGDDVLFFDLRDTTDPNLSGFNIPSGSIEYGSIITIQSAISDLYGISEVWATINLGAAFEDSIQLFDDGLHNDGGASDGVYGNQWDTTSHSLGLYNIDINATDSSTNPSSDFDESLSAGTFTVIDSTAPLIQNEDAYPNVANIFGHFNVTAQVTDLQGVSSVYATFSNAITGDFIVGIQLFDDGNHDDGISGDGVFGGMWDSSTYPIGDYNVSVNATDINVNSAFINNFETVSLVIVMPIVEIRMVSAIDKGYNGDTISLIFEIRTDTDINITNIILNFGTITGSSNMYFNFDNLNITLMYELTSSVIYTQIEINYTIDNAASIIDSGLNWWVYLDYSDEVLTPYSKSSQVTIGGGVKTYSIPSIVSEDTILDVFTDGSSYMGKGNANKITFVIDGTYFAANPGYYTGIIDLTSFSLGVQSLIWDSDNNRYYYTIISNLIGGTYDCSSIKSNITSNIPGLDSKVNEIFHTVEFNVDENSPIADLITLSIPSEIDAGINNFLVQIESYDNSTSIVSGMNKLTIEIIPITGGTVIGELTLIEGNLYRLSLNSILLGDDPFLFGDGTNSIRYTEIVCYDIAGNILVIDISSNLTIISDLSAPDLSNIGNLFFNINEIDISSTNSSILIISDRSLPIDITINDLGSGVKSVFLYYRVISDQTPSSSAINPEEWEVIELLSLGNGRYYNILKFEIGSVLEMVIVASDRSGNSGETEIITLSVEHDYLTENTSFAVIIVGLISALGFIAIYSLVYRKKVKITGELSDISSLKKMNNKEN